MPGFQLLEGTGKYGLVVLLPLQGQCKRIGGILSAVGLGVPNHAGIHYAEFPGLPFNYGAQVLQGTAHFSGYIEVVQPMNGLGAGHFLEHLGNFGMPLLQGLVGEGVIFEMSQRLPCNGAPEISLCAA